MIAHLTGILEYKGLTNCVLDVHGVGYELGMSAPSLAAIGSVGDQVSLYTYLQVKDDGLSLYGFSSLKEKLLFEDLISVSSVGPKLALSALSTYNSDDLAYIIATEDVKKVSSISGVGKKTAERIILELKSRYQASMSDASVPLASSQPGVGDNLDTAKQALYSMGFTGAEVELAYKGYEGLGEDLNQLITYGLKRLGA